MKNDELHKMMSEATQFLLDFNMLDNDYIKNVLILNIYKISNRIKNVEFILDLPHRKMLIYLELDWLGRTLYKQRLSKETMEMLIDVLPTYEFRVTYDRNLFEKSLELVKEAKDIKKGRIYEDSNNGVNFESYGSKSGKGDDS